MALARAGWLLCGLALLACAPRPAPAGGAPTADTPAVAGSTQGGETQAAAATAEEAGRYVPRRGHPATAEEYYREVNERARRRGVQVYWVHGPRGKGVVVDRPHYKLPSWYAQ